MDQQYKQECLKSLEEYYSWMWNQWNVLYHSAANICGSFVCYNLNYDQSRDMNKNIHLMCQAHYKEHSFWMIIQQTQDKIQELKDEN